MAFYKMMIQVNLDMTDSMGPGKLVRHMQNPSYTYDEYLICIGLGPSISSVICKNLLYSGPSYPGSPVPNTVYHVIFAHLKLHTLKAAAFDAQFNHCLQSLKDTPSWQCVVRY